MLNAFIIPYTNQFIVSSFPDGLVPWVLFGIAMLIAVILAIGLAMECRKFRSLSVSTYCLGKISQAVDMERAIFK